MENVINNKIGVSFFLKKMSHKDSVKKRGVYATIAYSWNIGKNANRNCLYGSRNSLEKRNV